MNFQGFGKTKSDLNGNFEFKTILPVAYLGRPPHIHLLVRDEFEIKLITQLYLENHPLNEFDFLFKKMNSEEKEINTLVLNRKIDRVKDDVTNLDDSFGAGWVGVLIAISYTESADSIFLRQFFTKLSCNR